MQQLTMLGGRFDEKVAPYAVGDVLETKFGRAVVTHVDSDIHGEVLVCEKFAGGSCVVLPRRGEVLYRSR
jgi:hypothetical protein